MVIKRPTIDEFRTSGSAREAAFAALFTFLHVSTPEQAEPHWRQLVLDALTVDVVASGQTMQIRMDRAVRLAARVVIELETCDICNRSA